VKAAEHRRTPKRSVQNLATTATLWTAAVLCRFLFLGLHVIHSFSSLLWIHSPTVQVAGKPAVLDYGFKNECSRFAAGGALVFVAWLIVRLIRTAGYSLRGKVALITGGSRGLGLVLARHICGQGGNVALIARDPDELARAKADLASSGAVLTIQCDLLDTAQIDAAVRQIIDRFGRSTS